MIKCNDLLTLFERMAREHWTYEWGASREGCVDCSGAFVYAYGQLGGPQIAHGSNSILRKSMGELLPMSTAQPGYAAVKIRAWSEAEAGNSWYGKAPGDCYHIGLVGRDGRILNARSTSAGFVDSDPSDGWTGCAPLLAVDYEGDEESVRYQVMVHTEKDPLRVRIWPGNGNVLGSVPRGAVVDVLSDSGDGWPRVRYNELLGYASAEYLMRVENTQANVPEDFATDQSGSTTLMRADGVSITLGGQWRIAED